MHFTSEGGSSSLTVTLDISPNDVDADNATTKQMVEEAKKSRRRFCIVQREYLGTYLFTYDPANQAQIELHLLAVLSGHRTEVTVNAEAGGIESWTSY
ncbi:hypothetical protein K3217_01155 [bacterium BD-1]|nr:hypothetical protein [Ottowia caeni]